MDEDEGINPVLACTNPVPNTSQLDWIPLLQASLAGDTKFTKKKKGRKELSTQEKRKHRGLLCAARDKELKSITDKNVWKAPVRDVPAIEGGIIMKSIWVDTWKVPPSTEAQHTAEEPITIKSRLCVKGYMEPRSMRTDASTASATGQRVVVAHAAAKGNVLISMDVQSAFLSGDEYAEGDPGRRIFVKATWRNLDGSMAQRHASAFSLCHQAVRRVVPRLESRRHQLRSCRSPKDRAKVEGGGTVARPAPAPVTAGAYVPAVAPRCAGLSALVRPLLSARRRRHQFMHTQRYR
eukprot:gene18101-biopygen34522